MTSGLRSARDRSRVGFSFPELMVVVVVASLLIAALQTSLVRQRRLYELQRAVTDRNETVRFAVAVFGAALREASLGDGDVDILAPDQMRVRVPHGFGVVCGANASGQRVGIVAPQGVWAAGAGDSVMFQRAGAWTVDGISSIDPVSNQVPCTLVSGGLIFRPDVRAPDADLVSPARAYRSQIFETALQNGSVWLVRRDGAQTEALLGPLASPGGFAAWYEDAAGVPVAAAAAADRVVVRVVARSPDVRGQPLAREDTLTMRFGRRNR